MTILLFFELHRLKILGSEVILETWVPILHLHSAVSGLIVQ